MKHLSSIILVSLLLTTFNCQPEGEITPLMECAACKAIVKVSLSELNGRTSELDVTDVLEYICLPSNFPSSEFPPPHMGAACEKVIRSYYDDIEEHLIRRKSEIDLDKVICVDELKICTAHMDVSLENKDMKKGIDGQFDMEAIKRAMKERGGDIKIAGGVKGQEDILKGIEDGMGEAKFIEDI